MTEGRTAIDVEVKKIVARFGIDETIAALARYCHKTGRMPVFRKLNAIFEWLTAKKGKALSDD